MPHPGFQTYVEAGKRALGPRAAEAAALMRAAGRLARAKERARGNPGDYAAWAAALRHNRVLWTVLQADLASGRSPLPAALRRDLLSLSVFVDRRTTDALARPRPDSLDALIAIDRALARGLSEPAATPR